MSNIKITDLPELTSVTDDDLFIIVDSGNPYITKKIAWKNIGIPSGSITDAPSGTITYGRRNNQWVDITAPANLQIRRGTASEVSGIIPLQGEPVWDTTNKILYIGDGSTYGGIPVSYPTKAYKFVNLPGGNVYQWFTINLSPQNSIWEINLFATFDLLSEGNSTATFSFASSTNIQQVVGNLIYTDPNTSSAQYNSLNTAFSSSATFNVASDGEILNVTGAFTVSSATGTLIFTEQNDNHEAGAQIAYLTLKRLI